MTFEHRGLTFNLLDTPGHSDFSEDTYRTLTAVDAAVMVIDVAKGIEAQTLKLFEVCRLRDIPIITFVNKVDREGLDPLADPRRDRRPAGARRDAGGLAAGRGRRLLGLPRPPHRRRSSPPTRPQLRPTSTRSVRAGKVRDDPAIDAVARAARAGAGRRCPRSTSRPIAPAT